MERKTWSPARALTFARGLYHVAACDGLDPRERRALEVFVERVGLPVSVDDLGAEPFDYTATADSLDSTWLRRTFIRACRLMIAMDGRVSAEERDALRALGAALGVGEEVALAELDTDVGPDQIVEWMADLAVDFVSWDDAGRKSYFWVFPHDDHPLAPGATVRVADGQALVVRHGDAITDSFGPGELLVEPTTLPGLAAAADWGAGPVSASLLFVRTGMSPLLRWGLADPVRFQTRSHGEVPIRAFGRFSTTFTDPTSAAQRFARRGIPSPDEFEVRLRRVVSGRFGEALAAIEYGTDTALIELLNDLDTLKDRIRPHLEAALDRSGLRLARFYIENLTGPLELGLKPVSRASRNRTSLGRTLMGGATSDTDERANLAPCVQCLSPVPTNARFCSRCGAAQREPCSKCGGDVPARARFCPGCGSPRRI